MEKRPSGHRKVDYVGSAKKDLLKLPSDVLQDFASALDSVCEGDMPSNVSRMQGNLRDVFEIKSDEDGDTYRAMFTLIIQGKAYVLHAFQKKSKTGRETPKHDLDLIRKRLKTVRGQHATR